MMRRTLRQSQTLFETKSHAWEEAGLTRQLAAEAARRARREAAVLLPLLAGVIAMYAQRRAIFGDDLAEPARYVTVLALLIIGWGLARAIGRLMGPALFRRMDPGTAGTVGFLVRLVAVAITLLVALRIAGLRPETLAVGGAVASIVLGLAAQQTLGNLFAGTVLLSARPFRVGDRVRLQAGGVAGQIEGVVSSLGLLYTTFAEGDDQIMVPNSVVLSAAIVPLREPDAVDVKVRLPTDVRPTRLQELLDERLSVGVRTRPHIELEEIDGDEVVVRISATPVVRSDGPRLADEVLGAVGGLGGAGGDGTREHALR